MELSKSDPAALRCCRLLLTSWGTEDETVGTGPG